MKKQIKLKQDDIQELTFDEVYYKFRNLVYKKTRQWFLYTGCYEWEELLQVGFINLWKAYEYYDIEWGCNFITIAYTFLDNGFRRYHVQHQSKTKLKTAQIKNVESLQSPISNKRKNDSAEAELMDFLEGSKDFSSEVIDEIVLKKIFSKFSKRQLREIVDYINGYSKSEIANETNKSRFTLNKTFNRFRTMYIKEMIR